MILLTGGTGFVGRHVARALVAEGCQVRSMSRRASGDVAGASTTRVQADLLDPESLRAALHGVETVIHAAAVLDGDKGSVDALMRVNVEGTRVLAQLAREAGVRRFLLVSSAGVYGDGSRLRARREDDPTCPGTDYERSKLGAERAVSSTLEGSDVRWSILRPAGLFGADRPATVAFFRLVATRWLWLHGPTRMIVHPTNVDDLSAAVLLWLQHPALHGEVINVGGERAMEYREWIKLVGERIGRGPRQFTAPSWVGSALARVGGAPLARFAVPVVDRSVAIDKARQLLGFRPLAFDKGVREIAAELGRAGVLEPPSSARR